MKAKYYFIALLIPAFIGTLTINAQSANKRHDRIMTVENNGHDGKKNKKNNTFDEVQQRTWSEANRQIRETERQEVSALNYRDPKHVSISNRNNPRSTYDKPYETYKSNGKNHIKSKDSKYINKPYNKGNKNKLYHNPAHMNIYWTRNMYREYARLYPSYIHWHYDFGYIIRTISALEAKYNLGEVARVYGRVFAAWYNRNTDEYLLFFGGNYPYQDFTMILPGHVARKFSRRPDRFFPGVHMTATGLITNYHGTPEMIVKQRKQLDLY